MPLWKPNAAEIAKLRARVEEKTEDEQLQDNYFFHGLYSLSEGLYANKPPANLWVKTEAGEWKRLKRKLSRREWIESFFMIRTKSGKIEPLKLNRAQRRLEAWILRMERAGVPVRIQILKARQLGFCVHPDTRVLTADMRWVKIKDVQPGDELVGVDENAARGKGGARRMRRSVVEAVIHRKLPSLRVLVRMPSGILKDLVLTPEHRLLALQRGGCMSQWRMAKDFKVGDKLRVLVESWEQGGHESGWMGGMIDGEGHCRGRSVGGASLSIAQLPGPVMDRVLKYLLENGYHHAYSENGSGKGFGRKVAQASIYRIDEIMRLIGKTRPTRYANGSWWEGKMLPGMRIGAPWAEVVEIEALPDQMMIDLQTSTKTFIAEGIVSHNSTYIQAVMFHSSLRGDRVRSLIVADNRERSETLLQIAEIARTCMPKSKDGDVWEFKMKSAATKSLVWTEPIGSEIRITSAEAPQPGRGGTRTMAHLSEGAFWPDAHLKQMGILASVPSLPGTYVFDESTANGDIGTFRDGFWDAWHQRAIPLAKRINPWHAEFYAWWEHDEYYFSKSYGLRTGLSKELEAEILATLNDEENWLLKQTTLVRWTPDTPWEEVVDWHTGEKKWRRVGVGPQPVSIDQLAWRRFKIADKEIGGDINRFNQEYPSRPEVAFLASGRPVFDTEIVGRYLNETADPIAVGWVLEAAAEDEPESV